MHRRTTPAAETPPVHRPSASYEAVTDRILSLLETGRAPWRKPWHAPNAVPMNAVSRRPYRGVNVLLLGLSRFADARWLTIRQANELGGRVRRGERASPAVFWKRLEVPREDAETGRERRETIPLLRVYNVFNVEQCEGLSLPPPADVPDRARGRVERAEVMVRTMPRPPRIVEAGGIACYVPQADEVRVPPIGRFETADAYYATLFHELGHSTGHASRLSRPEITDPVRFGSEPYSREELVAELASAFCCAVVGLDNSLEENAAAYVQGWMRALRSDPKALVTAAARAQRAADYIRGIAPEHG